MLIARQGEEKNLLLPHDTHNRPCLPGLAHKAPVVQAKSCD